MITVLTFIISGIIFFVLGWFLSKKIQKSEYNALFINQEKKHEESSLQLLKEQGIIADNFFQANKLDLLDKEQKRGVAIFAKACFGHPSPSKRQKLNATTNAFGAPDVLRTCHFATIIVNSMLAS